ncbi:unnamed protein product, partial [Closterium sp. NIES-53]
LPTFTASLASTTSPSTVETATVSTMGGRSRGMGGKRGGKGGGTGGGGEGAEAMVTLVRLVEAKLGAALGLVEGVLVRLHGSANRGGPPSSVLRGVTPPPCPYVDQHHWSPLPFVHLELGLVMEIACTSMIHARAPHFLWPYAVRYAAHHLNLCHLSHGQGFYRPVFGPDHLVLRRSFVSGAALRLSAAPLRTSFRLTPSPVSSLVSRWAPLTTTFTTRTSTGSLTLVTAPPLAPAPPVHPPPPGPDPSGVAYATPLPSVVLPELRVLLQEVLVLRRLEMALLLRRLPHLPTAPASPRAGEVVEGAGAVAAAAATALAAVVSTCEWPSAPWSSFPSSDRSQSPTFPPPRIRPRLFSLLIGHSRLLLVVPHDWTVRCPTCARPSSPFDDLRTVFLRSSPRRSPPQSILPSPPESSLTSSTSTPITDYYRATRPIVTRVLASLVTDPHASPSFVLALSATILDFAATRRLDYATHVVAARPLSAGGTARLRAALPRLLHRLSLGHHIRRDLAPREWHDALRTALAGLGFRPSSADPSLFVRSWPTVFFDLVYVNDLVFATSDRATLAEVKSQLQKTYTCTDLGELRHYLGLQITSDRAARTITLTQSHMVQKSSGPYAELVGCVILGADTVSWSPTRSSSLDLTSAVAAIYTGAMAAQELRWFIFLLTDLGERSSSAPTLFADNKAMILMCREPQLESRVKHIDVRYFLLREFQRRGQARFDFAASEANIANIFTKVIPLGDHNRPARTARTALPEQRSSRCPACGVPRALPCPSRCPLAAYRATRTLPCSRSALPCALPARRPALQPTSRPALQPAHHPALQPARRPALQPVTVCNDAGTITGTVRHRQSSPPRAALPYCLTPCSPRFALRVQPCSPCAALPCSPRAALPCSPRAALPSCPHVLQPARCPALQPVHCPATTTITATATDAATAVASDALAPPLLTATACHGHYHGRSNVWQWTAAAAASAGDSIAAAASRVGYSARPS